MPWPITSTVQPRFGGMRNKSKNWDGMREDRNFNGGMREKHASAGVKFAHFVRQDAGWKTENDVLHGKLRDDGIELK